MGDFPLMTENGTFIINGAERVVVSQLVRSPGVYYGRRWTTTASTIYTASIIPNRGAWLEFETDANDSSMCGWTGPASCPPPSFCGPWALATDAQILERAGRRRARPGHPGAGQHQLSRGSPVEIYKRLRPGEPPTEESARTLFDTLFYDPKRYDLAAVGRYKMNKKLRLLPRHRWARPRRSPSSIPRRARFWPRRARRSTRRWPSRSSRRGVHCGAWSENGDGPRCG